MNSGIGSLPKHRYVWVDSTFTHKNPEGFVKAVWFGLKSRPGEMWGCHVMFESGAVRRNVPPHAIAFEEAPETPWFEKDAQMWDCYGVDWSIHEYAYLKGLSCSVMLRKAVGFVEAKIRKGDYLFTVAPLNDGFSEAPDQDKEFMFIRLDNGRLTIQPTNRVLFNDTSFTEKGPVPELLLQTETWSCED